MYLRVNMKCPKCQSENREGVKFCEDCGARMELKCPSCGEFIPMGKRFCGECGNEIRQSKEAPAKELSLEDKIEKIRAVQFKNPHIIRQLI
jgi:predicted amidophosphoribosyltransferase